MGEEGIFYLFIYLFKKQPYIPSRKAVEHVERTKHVGKKEKNAKTASELEPGSPKVPRVGKGSSIT